MNRTLRVIDMVSREFIPDANVYALEGGQRLYLGPTDAAGTFATNVLSPLQVSHVGYELADVAAGVEGTVELVPETLPEFTVEDERGTNWGALLLLLGVGYAMNK